MSRLTLRALGLEKIYSTFCMFDQGIGPTSWYFNFVLLCLDPFFLSFSILLPVIPPIDTVMTSWSRLKEGDQAMAFLDRRITEKTDLQSERVKIFPLERNWSLKLEQGAK